LVTKNVPSNPTWLVKIFVKKRLTFFLHKIVFYLEQFVVLKDMLRAQSHNEIRSLHTQGNQAFAGWGDLDTNLIKLLPSLCLFQHLFCFGFFRSGSLV